MFSYQIDIATPGRKQTFITERLDTDEVIKTRLKSFIDAASSLIDFTIDIKPQNTEPERRHRVKTELKQQECLYEPGRICPLGDDQSIDSCLHCKGRG